MTKRTHMAQVFDFENYRAYLQEALNAKHGSQTRFAKALSCQPAHISKVLSGDAQLSLEQADLANEFLSHSPDQSDYFLLLVEYDRAGTARLKKHFLRHLSRAREAYLNMKRRFEVRDHLSENDKV